jgi:tRNA pseudouridine38-40 synthase
MRNFRLTVRYDGTDFFGWQTQPNARTVQQTLESAIASITQEGRIRCNASGRTDAGVHARGQVPIRRSMPTRTRSANGTAT